MDGVVLAKILVVEDNITARETLVELLELEDYLVESAVSAEDALELFTISDFDLAILDWQLPRMSGLELCSRIRKAGNRCGIIFLTGRDTTVDKIAGLDSGADDYVAKPFEANELLARVRSALRRGRSNRSDEIELGDIVVDIRAHTVIKAGQPVDLTAREIRLLEFLLRNRGSLFTLDSLVRQLWMSDEVVGHDAVRQCVKRIRTKIDSPDAPSIITTVKGLGYKID